MSQTILIVEDEPSIVTLIKYNLEQHNFLTEVAYDGEEAIERFNTRDYDLIILDIMLPKKDGITVCKEIRSINKHVPIIMLTAKDSEYDKIQGLEIGADDYLTKPFSPKELLARIYAILRRTNDTTLNKSHVIKNGDITIYPQQYKVYYKGDLLELTKKEFQVLVFLTEHKGEILSREQLLHAVWEFDFVGDSRIVDVQVSHLREKIEEDTRKPSYIKTVRGFGYKMEDYT